MPRALKEGELIHPTPLNNTNDSLGQVGFVCVCVCVCLFAHGLVWHACLLNSHILSWHFWKNYPTSLLSFLLTKWRGSQPLILITHLFSKSCSHFTQVNISPRTVRYLVLWSKVLFVTSLMLCFVFLLVYHNTLLLSDLAGILNHKLLIRWPFSPSFIMLVCEDTCWWVSVSIVAQNHNRSKGQWLNSVAHNRDMFSFSLCQSPIITMFLFLSFPTLQCPTAFVHQPNSKMEDSRLQPAQVVFICLTEKVWLVGHAVCL